MIDRTFKICPNCGGHHPITACSYALTTSSLAAMPGSVSELQGFYAAEIAIERMLDEAKEKCPERLLNINRQSAAYRAGAYESLLAAHCMMIYGSFPNHPINRPRILELLKHQNAPDEPPQKNL
jgi:hypothetical protein